MSDRDRITRVISLPIREVVRESTGTVLDTFLPLWRMSTNLANWAQKQLVTRDVTRTADMATLPRYDRAAVFGTVPRRQARRARGDTPARMVGEEQEGSLYRLFTDTYPDRLLWDGAAASGRDVLKNVEETWIGHKSYGRHAVLWKGSARPCHYRFPFPWPVPADKGKTLRLMRAEHDRPFASIPMPGEAEDRALLRLAGGREFRRQLRRFDWLLDGRIDRLRQGKVCGRVSGGRLVGADLKIVAAFDRDELAGGFTATVRTGPDSLWTCVTSEGDDPVVINFDHLRSLQVAHDRWAYRLRQDGALRDERRRDRGSMIRARFDRAKCRQRTEAQQAASRLVRAMLRRGVSEVEYDDGDRSFMARADGRSGLDWTALRAALRCECEEHGIAFQHTTGADDGK